MEELLLLKNILIGSMLVAVYGFLLFGLYTVIDCLLTAEDKYCAFGETKR